MSSTQPDSIHLNAIAQNSYRNEAWGWVQIGSEAYYFPNQTIEKIISFDHQPQTKIRSFDM